MRLFTETIGRRLRRLIEPRRPPDFVIGGAEWPYMRRWYLLPRNRWFNIYLHQILRDDDLALHDHPWVNVSLVLEGGYIEVCLAGDHMVRRWRAPGTVALRLSTTAHRLELPRGEHSGIARPS